MEILLFNKVKLNDDGKGIVRYVGCIIGKKGVFYGIDLTIGNGKNNGSYKNVQYFKTKKRTYTGRFVRETKIIKTTKTSQSKYPFILNQTVYCTKTQCKGIIKYIGIPQWVKGNKVYFGLELLQKKGVCNGTMNGISYFNTKNNFGIYVPSTQVTKNKKKAKKICKKKLKSQHNIEAIQETEVICDDDLICTFSTHSQRHNRSRNGKRTCQKFRREPFKTIDIYSNGDITYKLDTFSKFEQKNNKQKLKQLSSKQLKKLQLYLQSFAEQNLFGFNRYFRTNGYSFSFHLKHYMKKQTVKRLNGICVKIVRFWLLKESIATNICYADILNIIHSFYYDILIDKQLQHEFNEFCTFLSDEIYPINESSNSIGNQLIGVAHFWQTDSEMTYNLNDGSISSRNKDREIDE